MYVIVLCVLCCTVLLTFNISQNLEKNSLTQLLSSGHKLLDVRTAVEHAKNSPKDAMNVPLANIEQYIDKLDKYVLHCALLV